LVAVSGLVVEVRKLRMAYGSVAVLEDVSLLAAPGEVIAIMGVSGPASSLTGRRIPMRPA
jgi:ABC-type histidine transport system ATPase subunit